MTVQLSPALTSFSVYMEAKAKLSSKSHHRTPLDGLKPGRTRLSDGQSWDLQPGSRTANPQRGCEDLWREPVGTVHCA